MSRKTKTKKQPQVLYEVFTGVDSVLTTDNRIDAVDKVIELQIKQRDGVITIHDYAAGVVLRYKKEIHQKNWRLSEQKVEGLVYKVREAESLSPDPVLGEHGAVREVQENSISE
jgi:ATP-dependent Clp protease adapter protein ClpS